MRLILSVLFGSVFALAQTGALPQQFTYDDRAGLEVQQVSTSVRDGISVIDLSYASPRGGRVPAYLVVPAGKGPFAAIIFGHWANDENSPKTSNRTEFLDEAVALAHGGAVSLLIDAPFVRPGFKPDGLPFSSQETDVFAQQVVDIRRGIDLLLARKDIDPSRIAYVGHSFDAAVGGVLRGVEPRFKTLVLMAGVAAHREFVLSDEPRMARYRAKYGEDKIKAYLDTYDWSDPVHYVTQPNKAPVLLQMASRDEFGSEANFRRQAQVVAEPKTVKWYDAQHALNAQARKDRYEWLREQIHVGALPPGTLEKVPELK